MTVGAMLRTIRYMGPGPLARYAWVRMKRPWYSSRLYGGMFLAPRPTTEPNLFPPVLWPGEAALGDIILNGRIRLLGEERSFSTPADWQAADSSPLWQFALHEFEWLADLEAIGTDDARSKARQTIKSWTREHPQPALPAWHPYPLSLRVYAWLRHGPFLLSGANAAFRDTYTSCLDRQVRHLSNVIETDVGGNHLIKNLKVQIAAGLCLAEHRALVEDSIAKLKQALAHQILPDGGHYERSPSYHTQVLCDLVDLQDLLRLSGTEATWLDAIIRRMTDALAFFRHGDGCLALFNDGDIGDARNLDALDRKLGTTGDPAPVLAESGYHRISAGNSLVLLDAGHCCPDELPAHAHADCLSFEFSSGTERIVVNCGTYAYQDPVWRNRLRGTACHSTVDIDGSDSAEVYGAFRLGRRPQTVSGTRSTDNAGITLSASHDGYAGVGLLHHRRVTLANDGVMLTGEDSVERTGSGLREHAVTAHFHLHPGVEVGNFSSNGEVPLHLPNGEIWVFEAPGTAVSVEESVYAPRFHEMHQSRQILLKKSIGEENCRMRWFFKQLS